MDVKHFKWREDARHGGQAQITCEPAQHTRAIVYIQEPSHQFEPRSTAHTLTEHIPVTVAHVQEATAIHPDAAGIWSAVEPNETPSMSMGSSSSSSVGKLPTKSSDDAYNQMVRAELKGGVTSHETSGWGQSIPYFVPLPAPSSPTYKKLNSRPRPSHTKSKRPSHEDSGEQCDAVDSTPSMHHNVRPSVKIRTKHGETLGGDIADVAEIKVVDGVHVHGSLHGGNVVSVEAVVMSHVHDNIGEVEPHATQAGTPMMTVGASHNSANGMSPPRDIQSHLSSSNNKNKHAGTKCGAREVAGGWHSACGTDILMGQAQVQGGLSAEMQGTLYQSACGIVSENVSGGATSRARLLDETSARRPALANSWQQQHVSKIGKENGHDAAAVVDGKHSFASAESAGDCSVLPPPTAVVRPWQMLVSLTQNVFKFMPRNVNASPA